MRSLRPPVFQLRYEELALAPRRAALRKLCSWLEASTMSDDAQPPGSQKRSKGVHTLLGKIYRNAASDPQSERGSPLTKRHRFAHGKSSWTGSPPAVPPCRHEPATVVYSTICSKKLTQPHQVEETWVVALRKHTITYSNIRVK